MSLKPVYPKFPHPVTAWHNTLGKDADAGWNYISCFSDECVSDGDAPCWSAASASFEPNLAICRTVWFPQTGKSQFVRPWFPPLAWHGKEFVVICVVKNDSRITLVCKTSRYIFSLRACSWGHRQSAQTQSARVRFLIDKRLHHGTTNTAPASIYQKWCSSKSKKFSLGHLGREATLRWLQKRCLCQTKTNRNFLGDTAACGGKPSSDCNRLEIGDIVRLRGGCRCVLDGGSSRWIPTIYVWLNCYKLKSFVKLVVSVRNFRLHNA